jgi:hypothetical protein
MKATTVYRTDFKSLPRIPYPNAATRKEMFHKFLDMLLVGAIGAGLAACFLLILAFS